MRGMGSEREGEQVNKHQRHETSGRERRESWANDEGIVSEDSVDRVMRKLKQKQKIAQARSGECVCKQTEKTIERQCEKKGGMAKVSASLASGREWER